MSFPDFRRGAMLLALSLPLWASACGVSDRAPGLAPDVARRHVVLEGAANFRDLGGYATRDGRHVRWGLLYRSDNLSKLTDEDVEKVAALGIRLVCDFRGCSEYEKAPDRLPEPYPPRVAHLEIWDESFSGDRLREAITSGSLGDTDLRQVLIEANRKFATTFAPQYAAMFARITRSENLPALVHCTAGKDRAGFASALILRILGVPLETVYRDFLLTNHYTAARIQRTLWLIRLVSLFRVDPEQVRPVLGVERAYLEAAFDEIEEHWGSFEHFRRAALHLDDARRDAFRELLLE